MSPWHKAAAQKTVGWLPMVSVPGNVLQEGWSSPSQRQGMREHLKKAGTRQLPGADQGQVPEVASNRVKTTFPRT